MTVLTLGSLSFAAPWALVGLGVLPALWWLLRTTPPAPRRVRFPPVRLLFGLTPREESPARAPPWLLVLRLVLVASLVAGAAEPLVNAASWLRGDGPLYLVIDDGWAAGADWPARQAMVRGLIDQAERERRAVVVVTTAPGADRRPALALLSPGDAGLLLEALVPKPWASDRAKALQALFALDAAQPGHVVWLSDSLDGGGAASLVRKLGALGTVTVITDPPSRQATVLRPPAAEGEGLRIIAERPGTTGAMTRQLRALAEDGRLLARRQLDFADGERRAETLLVLPAELRNRLARLEIEDTASAAGVVLLDERWRRRPVGLVSGQGAMAEQPLLGATYYLERALEPYTELRRGGVAELLSRQLAVLVLADPGPLEPGERRRLEEWIADGGVAVRFAGPRLVEDPEALLPVALYHGDRVMGGALSWERPATLAPFAGNSPFTGLEVPGEVTVRRQVLARPSLDLAAKTWARLSDGTPLVTADRRGRGWLVLVHTTANAEWSDLPLSGLFVDMLRRLVGLSQGVAAAPGGRPLAPLETVDGLGRLGPAPADALAIAGDVFEDTVPGPRHPPGYYGGSGGRRALNLSPSLAEPRPFPRAGASAMTYGMSGETALKGWLLGAALVLAVIDLAASLALRGLLRRWPAVLVAAALAVPGPGAAQTASPAVDDDFALAASLHTRLAYMITGDPRIDDTSRAGLRGLGVIVGRRTAAELGEPMGIDPGIDELAFFPLIYWPLSAGQAPPSPAAVSRLNAYLRGGGTILFDTRQGGGGGPTVGLRELARRLDVPPLSPIPPDHVLGRAFYLLDHFPGRWTGDTVWVERAGGRLNDGVSPIIAGSHDWAAAWAMDDAQRPLYAVVPGGERQREMAYRFGVNLVMYVLTGNYKSDQVHLPAILERLGR